MTHPLLKQALHWLCLLAALALSACGPGTGGTGTGPQTIAPFAASYIGTQSAASPAGVATSSTGAGSSTSAAVSLQLQTTGIVVTSGCADFNYAGTWSVSSTGEISVQGIYSSAGATGQTSAAPQTAVLRIAFANATAESAIVTLSIQTPSGTLLLGPVTLQLSTLATPAAPKSDC
jgi:hypothetical protein